MGDYDGRWGDAVKQREGKGGSEVRKVRCRNWREGHS